VNRPQHWTLTHTEDGSWAVARGNRPVREGLGQAQAQGLVGRTRSAGEKVIQVEQDGYRTDLTKRFRDPAPAGPASGSEEKAPEPTPEPLPTRRGWPRHEWPRHEWGRR
jgi:hypothetical protein